MIGDLEQWLSVRMSNEPCNPDLRGILLALIAQWPVGAVIDGLRRDRARMLDVAGRSYRHENGFDRIELLLSAAPEYALRLHVWWGNPRAAREDIHGHPWNFASVVLCGSLNYEQYVECPTGAEATVLLYAPPSPGQSFQLNPGGTARLRAVTHGLLAPGSSYYAAHQMVHRVWTSSSGHAATIMLRGASIAYPAPIFLFGSDAQRASERRERPRSDIAWLDDSLERCRNLLPMGA